MNKEFNFLWRLAVLVPMSSASAIGQNSPEMENPNIIIIMADDMGYGDPHCYNPDSKIPTPNMDKLSEEGIRFSDAHSADAVCTPSRYGLLTGRYCWRSRLKKSVSWSGYDKPLITAERETLASVLKRNGYRTAVVGKWHLGMNFLRRDHNDFVQPKTYHEKGLCGTKDVDFSRPIYNGPNYLGFDYAFLSAAGHNMEPFCYIENDFTLGVPDIWREANDTLHSGVSAVEVHEGWMIKGWDSRKIGPDLTQKAIDFIKKSYAENPENPFFLYLPTVSPHRPCTPPSFVKGKSKAGERGDMVAEFDWTVGQIMKTLEFLKIEKNTLLIVTSDNGAPPTSDDKKDYSHKSCGDLRGFKASLYEGGHRIPLFIRWPNVVKTNRISDKIVCLTDIFATVVSIVGEKRQKGSGEDSYDLLSTITKDLEVRNSLVMHDYGGNFAVRNNGWKLIVRNNPSVASRELYNLNFDPREQNDLIDKYPEIAEELQELLDKYKRQGYSNE